MVAILGKKWQDCGWGAEMAVGTATGQGNGVENG